MEIIPLATDVLRVNFNLFETIASVLAKNKVKLKNGDVFIVSSKIIALSQERLIDLRTITPGIKALKLKKTKYGRGKEDPRVVELALREADIVFDGPFLLTLKNDVFIAAAGVDLSNAPKDHAIAWPKNVWNVARLMWNNLRKHSKMRNLGIVISDSHCQPLRWGVTGLALSWQGFEGVEDARGQKDIYGKPLRVTRKAVSDNLASSALLVMGEAGEKIPFVIIRNAPVKFTSRTQKGSDFFMRPEECIFSGIYNEKFRKML